MENESPISSLEGKGGEPLAEESGGGEGGSRSATGRMEEVVEAVPAGAASGGGARVTGAVVRPSFS
jgi:hypothetical protein